MGQKVRFSYLFVGIVGVVLWGCGLGLAANLTITKDGGGGGTVTSSPAGINCGADCTETYAQGKKVTLKAKADKDSTFTGWTGGGCSGTKDCTVMMNSDLTVISTFTAKTVDFSLSTDEMDFGELEVGSKVSKALTITNTGTADIEVEISGLDGTEFSISGKSIVSIKPQKSYKLKVTFKPTDAGGDEDLHLADPSAVQLEEAEDPDSGAGVKIINVQAQTNIQASNRIQTKSRTVTVKGDKKVQSKEYKLEVTHEFQIMDGGKSNGYTFTEKGSASFEIVQGEIKCYDSSGQYEILCIAATTLTVTGKLTGSDGICTINGTGTVAYDITGWVTAGYLLPNLKVMDFTDAVTMCCTTDKGTTCSGLPGFFDSNLHFYANFTFMPNIPFVPGGKYHDTPNLPGFTKASMEWKLIFPGK